MRTSKKLLSVLLAVLMCVNCFGLLFIGFAANVVTSVAVTSSFQPTVDGAFPTASDYTAFADGTVPLSILNIYVSEVDGDSETFQPGKVYQVMLVVRLAADSGYAFQTLSMDVTYNGEPSTSSQSFERVNKTTAAVSFEYSMPIETISSVTGAIADSQLVIGGTAYKMDANYSYLTRCVAVYFEKYIANVDTSSEDILVRGSDGTLTAVEKTALCEAGKTYYYSFRVEPDSGYVFSDELTVSFINRDTLAPMPVTVSNLSASGVDVLVELPAPVSPVAADDPRLPIDHELPYEVIDGLFVGSYPEGNCRWTFDPATGEMIFYATGENATVPPAAEVFELRAPYDFRFDVRSVYVDEGIRYIGFCAFSYMLGLRKLTLPSTLKRVILYDADYGKYSLPNLEGLRSLETLVSKSNAALHLTAWEINGPTSTFMNYGPINDVNDKRALMDIRCAYHNTLFGYRADMDFESDDPVAMLQSMVDAVNQKYGAHLPAVDSEEVIEGLLYDFIEGDVNVKHATVCPAYFRLICPPESAAIAEWQLLKDTMSEAFQEDYDNRVNNPNYDPNAPGTPTINSELLAANYLRFTTLLEPYHDPAVVNALYDNAVEDISTYTETKPSTYMDRRAANLTVTANASAGGSATGGGKFFQNETATLTATPGSGYHFTGWYEGSTKVSDKTPYSFTVTKDVTLTAQFEKDADPGNNGGNNNPQPQPSANRCHWCGKDHSGNFFQKIIGFFHNIFAKIFGNKY